MATIRSEDEGLPKEAKYAIGTVLGCLGLICLACVLFFVVASVPDAVGLPLSVTAAAVPAILYVLAIVWLDRYEREPVRLLLGAFFWGSVVAVVLAVILELLASLAVGVVAGEEIADVAVSVVGAPLAEEASKGLVLLVLFFLLKNEFDDTLDGIVYGAVVGLGFAMTEDIAYFGQQYLEGGTAALAEIFVLRAVLSGLAHALYTGTTGAGLGFARETTNLPLKILVPIGAFGLGIGQHFLWNGTVQALGMVFPETQSFLALLVVIGSMSVFLSGPAALALLIIVILVWRRERRVIARFLAGEVQTGVVTDQEYATLQSSRRRTLTLYRTLFTNGLARWFYLRKLYRTETELAFAKWHESQGERARRGSEDRFRAEIAAIRDKLVIR